MRAFVVEDERLPRAELCALLVAEGVDVVGEAASVDAAVRGIEQHEPDVVFLDIQLGRENAFELLERTRPEYRVIFVTAYDEYAVRAFEVDAVDYLLKPVDPERLRVALERLGDMARNSGEAPTTPRGRPFAAGERVLVRTSDRWHLLKIDDIRAIEASGDYSLVRLAAGKQLLLGRPLKEWEERLEAPNFVRIHRSTIVNLDFVSRIEEWFNRTYRVWVEGIEEPYQLSRRYAATLKG